MTMLVWAACDNFALMMADRRAYSSKVVSTPDGAAATFGALTLGADVTKAVLSADARDLFAVAGTSPAEVKAREVLMLHGIDADRALLARLLPEDPVAQAIDPQLLGAINAVLHGYTRHGRMVCCRTQWSPAMIQREILVAPQNKIALAVAGSGGAVVVAGKVPAPDIFTLVHEWRAPHPHLVEMFRAVSNVDPGVGPDVDTWTLIKGERVWRKQDDPPNELPG